MSPPPEAPAGPAPDSPAPRFGLVRFVRSAGVLSVSSVANLVRAVVTAKVLAITLGPSLVGVLSQLLNFSALATTVIALGLTTGVVKLVAETRDDPQRFEAVTGTAAILSLVSGGLTAAALAPFAGQLSALLTGSDRYGLLVVLIVASFPLYNLAGILGYVLQGLGDVRGLTVANVITALAAIVVLVPATFRFGIAGAIASVLAMSLVQSAIFGVAVARSLESRRRSWRSWRFSRGLASSLLGYGGVVLLGGVVLWASLLAVRTITIHVSGNRANGLYQVAYGLSNQYVTVFMTWMAAYVFPAVAGNRDGRALGPLLNSALRANLFLMAPVLCLTLALRRPLIALLYSPSFLDAAPLISMQALGDLLRVIGWSFGVALFARGHLRSHLAVVAGQGIAWTALAAVLVPALGLPGVTIAYAGSFAIYPVLGLWLARRQLQVTIEPMNLGLSALAAAAVLAAAFGPPAAGVLAALAVPAAVLARSRRLPLFG